jgi:hypothetical protein
MWRVETTDCFDSWLDNLEDKDRISVLASLILLQERGAQLPRPYADTIKGSIYPNMKELRIQSHGKPIRAFFAFDPERVAILLCAGNKKGNEKRFYQEMIPLADREYAAHLAKLSRRK